MSGSGGRGGGGAPRVRKVMTQAINLIFEFLKNVRSTASMNMRNWFHFHEFTFQTSLKQFLIRHFQISQKERVQIWLYENTAMKMEGVIIVRNLPQVQICTDSFCDNVIAAIFGTSFNFSVLYHRGLMNIWILFSTKLRKWIQKREWRGQ